MANKNPGSVYCINGLFLFIKDALMNGIISEINNDGNDDVRMKSVDRGEMVTSGLINGTSATSPIDGICSSLLVVFVVNT